MHRRVECVGSSSDECGRIDTLGVAVGAARSGRISKGKTIREVAYIWFNEECRVVQQRVNNFQKHLEHSLIHLGLDPVLRVLTTPSTTHRAAGEHVNRHGA